jgi:hypothetical protein
MKVPPDLFLCDQTLFLPTASDVWIKNALCKSYTLSKPQYLHEYVYIILYISEWF